MVGQIDQRIKHPSYQSSLFKHTLLALLTLATFLILQSIFSTKVSAYEHGYLIDDAVFLDAKSMNASQIQSFLDSKSGVLKSRSFKLDCDADGIGGTAKQLYIQAGAPCGSTIPASQIIYYTAQVYGINPKVIIATLQKEQSLITDSSPSARAINQAMGYACPTSGVCDTNSSFFWQIDNGTWVMRFHFERARKNNNWWYTSSSWTCGTAKTDYYSPNLYPGQNVKFYDPYSKVHYATVYIKNAATSAFYCYTPHVFNNHSNSPHPDDAKSPRCWSFHPASGNKGRCYTGSYNFVKTYENWFGSPIYIYNVTPIAYDNSTDTTGELATIGFTLSTKPTASVTFTVNYDSNYVSSAESKVTITPENWNNGRKNLVILKGKNTPNLEGSVTLHLETGGLSSKDPRYNASASVTPDVPVLHQDSNKNVYRLYNSSTGAHLFTGSVGEKDALVSQGWNDEGTAFYGCEAGNVVLARLKKLNSYKMLPYGSADYQAHINNGFVFQTLVTTTSNQAKRTLYAKYRDSTSSLLYTLNPTAGDSDGFTNIAPLKVCDSNVSPVFRLYSGIAGNHFFTQSTSERNRAREKYGFRYEGVGFYIRSGGTIPVYRLYSGSQGNHFFTASESEKISAANHGFRYEGVAFRLNVSDTSDVYRLYSGSAGNHFYTYSPGERDSAQTAGYRLEGIGFSAY
jgi:hypothetical protein